jgi:ubiquitin-activating enzyme E1
MSIDSNLYSRQIYVLGKDAMEKISKSTILISGLDGLGTEIAKCLVLGGIKKLLIHDNKTITMKDLASCYYYSESNIDKLRTEIILEKLRGLNPYVEINISNDFAKDSQEVELVIISNFENYSLDDIILINKNLHKSNKKMIMCSTLGLLGQIFCDFNENFIVTDCDGEEIKSGTITEISKDKESNNIDIEIAIDHNLDSSNKIKIKNKETEFITNIQKIINSKKIQVENNSFFDNYLKEKSVISTNFEQVKEQKIMNFDDLETSLKKSDKIHSFNLYDQDHTNLCHRLFMHHHFKDDLKDLYDNSKEGKKKEFEFFEKFFFSKNGNFIPIQSIIGSIVAQEGMKAVSGKFSPINQWLYFDEINLIDIKNISIDPSSRYYGQELIFGQDFQKKLKESKVFIIGSGAIGCEHLKNFGMMGVGNIVITDMDTIEKSNLNRQFLFRNHDIGRFKSEIAGRETMIMNADVKVEVHKNKVEQETEVIYNEDFFNSLTCVANALDNVSARLFVDSLCIKYKKPLIESGTLGTKGNVQTIIPHLTETYGSQVDPPEKTVPFCTLKNFPYQIEHTIQYSRDYFQGLFVNIPEKINTYLDKKEKYLETLTLIELEELYRDIEEITNNIPNNLEDCIKYSHQLWYKLFNHQIKDLIKQFPENEVNDIGNKFWSGTKKFPQYTGWEYSNEDDRNFILACSILRSKLFGIEINPNDIDNLIAKLDNSSIEYNESGKKIGSNEEEQKKLDQERMNSINRIQINERIENLGKKINSKLFINEFEKDDDTNFHINFVHSFSNLRANNYKIETVDAMTTKRIAGKIIPAIATTTSLVSGLVAIEFIKILKGKNKIEDYRNYFVNLALPLFTYSEPGPVQVNTLANGKFNFTLWDSFDFKDVILQEILDFFEKNYNINITMVNHGQKMLFSGFMSMAKAEARKNMKISQIYKEVYNQDPENKIIEISVVGEEITNDDKSDNDENNEIELPNCKVYI